ncbi:hypothetical protein GCM10023215_21120 [Pseudonocardia yuanmonensis]|uniref:Uncharacterized protein n=1 Tax=Pseudonocardia yuanmonensis TaxID=1095914 RepID=A0ABP8WDH4_9PSEU
MRTLLLALKPVTGDPAPAVISTCPNVVDEGETTRECGAKLRAPLRDDMIHCRACGRRWPRNEWEHLGQLLQAAAA